MPKKWWSEILISGATVQTSDCNRVFNSMHAALLALGLTQTSDTGQLNGTGTISVGSAPTTGDTIYGYRVYAFTDSLSATDPLFLKVTFRSTLGLIPGFMVELGGPTTDGAGNVANSVSVILGPSTAVTTAGAPYVSGLAKSSHVITGDGFIMFAPHVGALTTSTNFTAWTPDSPDQNLCPGWAILGRPSNMAGVLQPGKVAALDPGIHATNTSIFTSAPTGFYRTSYYAPRMKARAWGQAERSHENFCTLLLAGGVLERDGSIPVGRCFADFGPEGLLPLPWMGVVSHTQMGNGDTTQLTLFGSTPKTYLHLNKALISCTPTRLYLSSDGKARFTSPLIQWDGIDV